MDYQYSALFQRIDWCQQGTKPFVEENQKNIISHIYAGELWNETKNNIGSP